ncbi:hypothetical protein BD779DRAFT_1783818 [Infundibulicybe gibba]|nr:hypothetical protein BD779DRAFT_1783818 [Infundibulicybe gibba]
MGVCLSSSPGVMTSSLDRIYPIGSAKPTRGDWDNATTPVYRLVTIEKMNYKVRVSLIYLFRCEKWYLAPTATEDLHNLGWVPLPRFGSRQGALASTMMPSPASSLANNILFRNTAWATVGPTRQWWGYFYATFDSHLCGQAGLRPSPQPVRGAGAPLRHAYPKQDSYTPSPRSIKTRGTLDPASGTLVPFPTHLSKRHVRCIPVSKDKRIGCEGDGGGKSGEICAMLLWTSVGMSTQTLRIRSGGGLFARHNSPLRQPWLCYTGFPAWFNLQTHPGRRGFDGLCGVGIPGRISGSGGCYPDLAH